MIDHLRWKRAWRQRRSAPQQEAPVSRRWTYTCEPGHDTHTETIAEYPPSQLPCGTCAGPARLRLAR